MTLETAMRNARTKNPAAFDAALQALGFAKDTKRPSRFAQELRRRFKSPQAVLRRLGLDAALLKSSKSYSRDDVEPEAWDEKVRAFLSDKGWDESSVNELFEMLPERAHIRGQKIERDTRDDFEDFAQHGHAMQSEDDEEDQRERQDRLEHSERRYAREDKRDDADAERREARNSRQNEDTAGSLRNNYIAGGSKKGGRLATDDFAGLDELIGRVGTSMSTPAARQLEAKIKKRPDPSDDGDFLALFPEAARIGFSRSERKPILVIRDVCETGPVEANGKIRLLAKVASGKIAIVGLVDAVGDMFNSPLEISIWDQFVMDQLDSNATPKFGGLSNPKWDRDGPVASLQFDTFN
jgi:hypothetical protein